MRGLIAICLVLLWLSPPLSAAWAQEPTAKDKCPVCGMFVAKYPDWTASIAFKGAATLFFDGPKDLFTYYLNPGKYTSGRAPGMITQIRVKDYYTLAAIDARKAYYVVGSTVYGPMGKELVPFAKKADAEAFMRDHKGQRLLGFPQVTPAVMKTLE